MNSVLKNGGQVTLGCNTSRNQIPSFMEMDSKTTLPSSSGSVVPFIDVIDALGRQADLQSV